VARRKGDGTAKGERSILFQQGDPSFMMYSSFITRREAVVIFLSRRFSFQIISFHVVALLIILELRKKTKDVDHGFIFFFIIIIII
jgi:hypothetical protein